MRNFYEDKRWWDLFYKLYVADIKNEHKEYWFAPIARDLFMDCDDEFWEREIASRYIDNMAALNSFIKRRWRELNREQRQQEKREYKRFRVNPERGEILAVCMKNATKNQGMDAACTWSCNKG
jgi:hypothetical protein